MLFLKSIQPIKNIHLHLHETLCHLILPTPSSHPFTDENITSLHYILSYKTRWQNQKSRHSLKATDSFITTTKKGLAALVGTAKLPVLLQTSALPGQRRGAWWAHTTPGRTEDIQLLAYTKQTSTKLVPRSLPLIDGPMWAPHMPA